VCLGIRVEVELESLGAHCAGGGDAGIVVHDTLDGGAVNGEGHGLLELGVAVQLALLVILEVVVPEVHHACTRAGIPEADGVIAIGFAFLEGGNITQGELVGVDFPANAALQGLQEEELRIG
jgi:hypothetical protein